jgi:hypothetical protein
MPLKLTRRAGSSSWWITGTINGERICESSGTDRRELAEETWPLTEIDLGPRWAKKLVEEADGP